MNLRSTGRTTVKVAVLLFLTFTIATVGPAQEVADDSLVNALVSEGLTHDQAERVRAKVEKSEKIASASKINNPSAKGLFPIVPTTKVLAIGRFTSRPTPEQMQEFFPREVPATLQLYLNGKIDQWWVRQDQTGPVFLMNVTSVAEARDILGKLPLGQAKLMEFDYIELGPLSPLNLLLKEGWAKSAK
jgi:hypothetical protein